MLAFKKVTYPFKKLPIFKSSAYSANGDIFFRSDDIYNPPFYFAKGLP